MTTLSRPPIASSQVWDPRTTPGEEPQDAATVLSRPGPRAEPTAAPAWLTKLQERIRDLPPTGLSGTPLPYTFALMISELLAELAPPGTAVELELPGGETVRVERPDPEFAQAVRYLRALTGSQRGEARTPAAVAVRCVQILGHLRAGVPDLPVPTLAPGPDGMVGMTWDTDRDHLNLEVFPDGHVEVFHEDLVSGGLWSVDRAAGPPQEFLSRLRAAFAPR